MIRVLIITLLIIISLPVLGQDLKVIGLENCSYWKKGRIRKDDILKKDKKIWIRNEGYIILEYNTWNFSVGDPGIYSLDSLLSALTNTTEYMVHDSIRIVLEKAQLLNCRRVNPGELKSTPYAGEKEYPQFINPELRVSWNEFRDYKGGYYFIIFNMFDVYIDLKYSKQNHIDLKRNDYGSEDTMIIYKIVSEDCRETDIGVIKFQ